MHLYADFPWSINCSTLPWMTCKWMCRNSETDLCFRHRNHLWLLSNTSGCFHSEHIYYSTYLYEYMLHISILHETEMYLYNIYTKIYCIWVNRYTYVAEEAAIDGHSLNLFNVYLRVLILIYEDERYSFLMG